MENFFLDLFTVFLQILFLLGLIMVALWFYFRLKQKQEPIVPFHQPPDEYKRLYLSTKLQACERLILFLERISPANLILRVHTPDMTAAQLQAALIRTVREEFEYNLSQQLYISARTWELIFNAKEETIRMINAAAAKLSASATSRDLASGILQLSLNQEPSPISGAIESIREEIR
ncbi:MAG: hypothetical protein V1733_11035 [bacterium]